MARGKITAETVKALVPDDNPDKDERRDRFLWDDRLAGFGVKVTPSGSKIYIVQYRQGGRGHKTQRYTIGKEGGAWRPQKARDEAERLLRMVGQGGNINAMAKEAARVATDLAFSPYVERFGETTLKAHWPKSWGQAQRCLELHASPHWKDRSLPSITRADVVKVLARLDHAPATKRYLYAVLSYMFAQAVKADDVAVSPMAGIDAPPAVPERGHTLDHDELRWLWLSTFELSDPYGPIYRQFILLGQRRGEIAGIDWRELHRPAGEWHLPAARAKNGTDTIVPLPGSTVTLLDGIAGKERWPRQGLVFPSGKGTPVSGFSKTKRRLDALMQAKAVKEGGAVRPWRTHDLRRTLATNQQALGTSFEVVEHLLNHKEKSRTGIGKVYQTHNFKAEKRLAIERWETELARIVAAAPAVVVPLRRAKG